MKQITHCVHLPCSLTLTLREKNPWLLPGSAHQARKAIYSEVTHQRERSPLRDLTCTMRGCTNQVREGVAGKPCSAMAEVGCLRDFHYVHVFVTYFLSFFPSTSR